MSLSSMRNEEIKEDELKLDDDDWLNTDFGPPAENMNFYPPNSSTNPSNNVKLFDDYDDEYELDNDEIETGEMEEDDEGFLEATRIHQLTDENYKELQLEMQCQYRLEDDKDFEDEDFEDQLNAPMMFTVMDAYHAFTMKKRVEEANEQWQTGPFHQLTNYQKTDEEEMETRITKVTFGNVEFYPIGNDDDETKEEIDSELTQESNDLLNEDYLTFNSIDYDCQGADPLSFASDLDNPTELNINDSLILAEQVQENKLTLETVDNQSINHVHPEVTKWITLATEDKVDVKETRSKKKVKKLKAVKDSHLKCKKLDIISQQSSLTTSLSKEPTQASKLRNLIKVSKLNNNEQTSLAHRRAELKMLESLGPFISGDIKLGNITSNSFIKRTDTKLSFKPNVSIFPTPAGPPSINPILQSILHPENLSILAKSCNPNSNVLRELKTQILKHNIQKSALKHILNKKIINLIYTNNNNTHDSNSIISIGCQTHTNYHQQTVSSKSKTKCPTKSHHVNMEGQGDKRRNLLSSNYYCQVQETSKWASKPEFNNFVKNSHKLKTEPFTCSKMSKVSDKIKEISQKRMTKLQMGCQSLSMEVNSLGNSNKMATTGSNGKLPLMSVIQTNPSATRKKIPTINIPRNVCKNLKSIIT